MITMLLVIGIAILFILVVEALIGIKEGDD
jgi:hypothetical protein